MQEPHEERRMLGLHRRSKERQGKYDRRKNRCGGCYHLKDKNYCEKWERAMDEEAFACIYFSSLPE